MVLLSRRIPLAPVDHSAHYPLIPPFSHSPEFLVIFKRYMPHNQHKSLIARILGQLVKWELIERENPGQSLPSDFAVIKVLHCPCTVPPTAMFDLNCWTLSILCSQVKPLSGQSVADAFIVPLSRDAAVKHVIPQRRFINILSAEEDAEDDVVNAFSFDPFSIEFKGRYRDHAHVQWPMLPVLISLCSPCSRMRERAGSIRRSRRRRATPRRPCAASIRR